MLLEVGALCERDTFQGERCLYNALNKRIRNLLLSYDYSKSVDPLQPLAAHFSSLLGRDYPKTSDITIIAANQPFHLHKFVLAARSPYFAKRLSLKPGKTWKLAQSLPFQSFHTSIRYLYLGEVGADLGGGEEEQAVLKGIGKLGRQLEIPHLFEGILASENRRLARQLRSDEVKRGQAQMQSWFKDNVLTNRISVDSARAGLVKWDRSNSIYADVLLRADEKEAEDDIEDAPEYDDPVHHNRLSSDSEAVPNVIPIGPSQNSSTAISQLSRHDQRSVLYPAHRAMLIRSEYFLKMFSSNFREAQETPYLQIITLDFSPPVLEIILTFLYTETASIPLDLAIDTVYAADMLCLDKLKMKAAVIISTLGNDTAPIGETSSSREETENSSPKRENTGEGTSSSSAAIDIYDVIRAGWQSRLPRLEEFSARYIANRLENFIDEDGFLELVRESAERIKERQETDTIELIDEYDFPWLLFCFLLKSSVVVLIFELFFPFPSLSFPFFQ